MAKKRAHKAQSRSVSPPPPPLATAETGECSVDCSGQSCRSCSAALVADCVALCCCPLAVVSLIGLAFIKVPCAVGKRCFGRSKTKEKEKVRSGRKQSVGSGKGCFVKEETVLEIGGGGDEIVEQRSFCRAEAIETDDVLLEMYELGHVGFGRVSYTETESSGIGNS